MVDQLDPSNIANEAKVGYTTLDASTALQVSKDAELLNTGVVDGVTWNFSPAQLQVRVAPLLLCLRRSPMPA